MNKRKEGGSPQKIYTDKYNEPDRWTFEPQPDNSKIVLDIYKDYSKTIKNEIKSYLKKVSRWN